MRDSELDVVETNGGLPVDMALHYYSRARMMANLAPLLAAGHDGSVGHVINVNKTGMEAGLIRSDLGLMEARNWSFMQSASHCQYMTSVILERLAGEYPGKLALVSASPGLIINEGFRKINFPWWFRIAWFLLGPFLRAFYCYTEEEAGERLLFLANNDYFPPALQDPPSIAGISTTGKKGDGAYAVDRKGEICSPKRHAKKYTALGDREAFRKEIWDHTIFVWEEAKQRELAFRASEWHGSGLSLNQQRRRGER